MIEYAKTILPAVGNWETLFEKELVKSLEWMAEDEYPEFYLWCYTMFSHVYADLLDDVFSNTGILHEICEANMDG